MYTHTGALKLKLLN